MAFNDLLATCLCVPTSSATRQSMTWKRLTWQLQQVLVWLQQNSLRGRLRVTVHCFKLTQIYIGGKSKEMQNAVVEDSIIFE